MGGGGGRDFYCGGSGKGHAVLAACMLWAAQLPATVNFSCSLSAAQYCSYGDGDTVCRDRGIERVLS